PVIGIELALGGRAARHEIGDLAREVGDLELLDAPCTALAREQVAPALLDPAAHGGNQPKPSNDDAAQGSHVRSISGERWPSMPRRSLPPSVADHLFGPEERIVNTRHPLSPGLAALAAARAQPVPSLLLSMGPPGPARVGSRSRIRAARGLVRRK